MATDLRAMTGRIPDPEKPGKYVPGHYYVLALQTSDCAHEFEHYEIRCTMILHVDSLDHAEENFRQVASDLVDQGVQLEQVPNMRLT